MRTGRERLIEWVQDIQADAYQSRGDYNSAEDWADSIMWDINHGIITKEES